MNQMHPPMHYMNHMNHMHYIHPLLPVLPVLPLLVHLRLAAVLLVRPPLLLVNRCGGQI